MGLKTGTLLKYIVKHNTDPLNSYTLSKYLTCFGYITYIDVLGAWILNSQRIRYKSVVPEQDIINSYCMLYDITI